MKLLKVLNRDLKSPFKDFKYEIGKEYNISKNGSI